MARLMLSLHFPIPSINVGARSTTVLSGTGGRGRALRSDAHGDRQRCRWSQLGERATSFRGKGPLAAPSQRELYNIPSGVSLQYRDS